MSAPELVLCWHRTLPSRDSEKKDENALRLINDTKTFLGKPYSIIAWQHVDQMEFRGNEHAECCYEWIIWQLDYLICSGTHFLWRSSSRSPSCHIHFWCRWQEVTDLQFFVGRSYIDDPTSTSVFWARAHVRWSSNRWKRDLSLTFCRKICIATSHFY